MSPISSFIHSRNLYSLFGFAALFLFLWYVGPMLAIAGFEPFREPSQRLISIAVCLIVWIAVKAWKDYLAKEQSKQFTEAVTANAESTQMISAQQTSQEEIHAMQERMKEALATLTKLRLGSKSVRQFLSQLPWYILIGPPASGKTTLLVNSNLHFPLADRFGNKAIRGVGGTRNCDWWFAENAVLLDTAGRFTSQDSQQDIDHSSWLGFLNLLKQYRPKKPFNGVIIAISITDLIEWKEQQRQNQATNIRNRISELHEHFGMRFPVYLMFTKCDLLSGFMEYFTGMDQESRAQVWGMTFPLEETEENNPINAFDAEFDCLQQRIETRLIRTLENERNADKRNLIYTFPQQFSALKEIALQFCKDIFQTTKAQQPAMVRGVYFTSATQEGTPIDRLMGNIADNFGLDNHKLISAFGKGKSFFINRLLNEVIFYESGLAGTNIQHQRKSAWVQQGALIGMIITTLLCLTLLLVSYSQNKSYIKLVHTQTVELEEIAAKFDADQKDIIATLPLLDKARNLSGDMSSPPWFMQLGLYQGDKLGAAGKMVYTSILNEAFLDQIMTRIEQQIKTNKKNSHYLYETLKVYLMLDNRIQYNKEVILAWIILDWDLNLAQKISAAQLIALKSHLEFLFSTPPSLPRSINEGLIKQVHATIKKLHGKQPH